MDTDYEKAEIAIEAIVICVIKNPGFLVQELEAFMTKNRGSKNVPLCLFLSALSYRGA